MAASEHAALSDDKEAWTLDPVAASQVTSEERLVAAEAWDEREARVDASVHLCISSIDAARPGIYVLQDFARPALVS